MMRSERVEELFVWPIDTRVNVFDEHESKRCLNCMCWECFYSNILCHTNMINLTMEWFTKCAKNTNDVGADCKRQSGSKQRKLQGMQQASKQADKDDRVPSAAGFVGPRGWWKEKCSSFHVSSSRIASWGWSNPEKMKRREKERRPQTRSCG